MISNILPKNLIHNPIPLLQVTNIQCVTSSILTAVHATLGNIK